MTYKIAPNVIAILFAVIIGAALFKQIDFQNWTVEKPLLALSTSSAFSFLSDS